MPQRALTRVKQTLLEMRAWYLTVLIVTLLGLLAMALYVANYRPMQFLYMLF